MSGRGLATVVILALALGLAGCRAARPQPMHPEAPAGRWYVLGPDDTLEGVARQAGIPVEDILEANGLPRADVKPGKLIFVLDPMQPGLVPAGEGMSAGAGTGTSATPAAAGAAGLLRWPLDARDMTVVASSFGTRDGRPHEGIDLPAPIGTPIFAAAAGRVIYAGDGIRGYGNMVVLEHAGGLLTVYAHSSVLLVREGDRVATGDRVALVGQSGRARGPHLHFEVRQGQIPQDPMLFLSRSRRTP